MDLHIAISDAGQLVLQFVGFNLFDAVVQSAYVNSVFKFDCSTSAVTIYRTGNGTSYRFEGIVAILTQIGVAGDALLPLVYSLIALSISSNSVSSVNKI